MFHRILCFATLCTIGMSMPVFAQTVDSVAPELLRRDATTEVVVRGSDLGAATGAVISGGDLVVSGFAATAELIRFDVGAGARAGVGSRDLTLTGIDVELADAFEVVAGEIELLSVSPAVGSRRASLTLAVSGSNLDTITGYDFGDGIEVTGFSATSATRGTVSITIEDAAFSGPRSVTASRADDDFTLFGGFTVSGGVVELSSVTPNRGVRGETFSVRINGTNLDQVDSVSFGSRISVDGFRIESPTRAFVNVTVRDDAVAGTRAVQLRTGEESVSFAEQFSVRRGAISVIAVRPDRVRQGDVTFVAIDGLNLDGLETFDAGPGIEITAISSEFPTSVSVDIEVAMDAPVGFRDVTVSGPAGTTTVDDAIVVGEFIPPALDLRIPDEVEVGETEIGTYRRAGFEITNRGQLAETIDIIGVDGDVELFALLDELGHRVNRRTLEIGVGESVLLLVEFSPELRGRSGVEYDVFARGDEQVGSVVARALGVRQELEFSLEAPFDFGIEPANTQIELRRLDTELRDGVPSRQVHVVDSAFRLSRDGEAIDPGDLFTVDFQSAIGGDEFFWGTTEILWTLLAGAGHYEGELLLETDDLAARYVPFAFIIDLEGDAPADPAADAGGDAGADAGVDAGADAGADTGTDSGTDSGIDTSPDAGNDIGMSDAGNDVALEDGGVSDTDSDAGTGGGGGGGGCCATSTAPRPSLPAVLLVFLGMAAVRRRAAR